jgi:hypothetical protein
MSRYTSRGHDNDAVFGMKKEATSGVGASALRSPSRVLPRWRKGRMRPTSRFVAVLQ